MYLVVVKDNSDLVRKHTAHRKH